MQGFLRWLDERTGLVTGLGKVAHYTVPAHWCMCRFLPVAIIFAFILQGITGLFLWAFYAPSGQTAWESVYYIQYQLPYGWLVRGIHHYSAQVLVAMLFLSVFLLIIHGAYRRPREFVYWAAVVMFLMALCSCLTGDLLMWSLSGYFATITRVSFLQLLPKIGLPLYQLVVGGPDPQFGTLTLTRFIVLHVAVFGGGGFVMLLLWKWFDLKSRPLSHEKDCKHPCGLACAAVERKSFWNWDVLWAALACVVTMAIILVLVFQHSLTPSQVASRDATLPAESYLGADLSSPADPGSSFDAARPEWSFRALYHMTRLPIFSKIGMVYAIFGVSGILVAFFLAIPILARVPGFHFLIVLITVALFGVTCWFTYLSYWDDYKNPDHAPTFLASVAQADTLAKRSVELCAAPDGIPTTGALSLLKKDPFVQGPLLFSQHCASCHNFAPFGSIGPDADFTPIDCADPSAPNLYKAISPQWIGGFCDADRLVTDDFFGKTTSFAKNGSMITYLKGRVFGGVRMDDGSLMLNTSDGLIGQLIAPDASPAFDILEESLTELVEDDDANEKVASGEYLDLLKEKIAEKFDDPAVMAALDPKLPQPVADALKNVLIGMVDDEQYAELLTDEDNIESITDDDIDTFLTDVYLAKLCGEDEPIPADETQYIDQLREGVLACVAGVEQVLYQESQLDAPRAQNGDKWEGLAETAVSDMTFLRCTECHSFYGSSSDHACDLRGYMSKPWLVGIISDPTAPEYYGAKNDRMPAYCPKQGDRLMSAEEVDMLADWLHGRWYRAPEVKNDQLFGEWGGKGFFPCERQEGELLPRPVK